MAAITLTLYHGTPEDIDRLDLAKAKDGCAFGRGFYLCNDLPLGWQYSGGRDPVVARVRLENPYVVDMDAPYEEYLARSRVFRPNKDARERLIAAGYDGVVVKEGRYREVVAFHEPQVDVLGRGATLKGWPRPSPEPESQPQEEAAMPRTVLIDEFDPIFDDNRVQRDLERGSQGVAFRIDSMGKTYWVFDPEARPASPYDEYTLFDSEVELLEHFRSLAPSGPHP